MRANAKSECCSDGCARAYARDIGKPTRWGRYAPGDRCEKCNGVNSDARYRWCQGCRAVQRERVRQWQASNRARAAGELPPATNAWLAEGGQ